MVTVAQVESKLDSIRPLVAADGAGLELVTVHDGTVTLRLSVQDVHCLDCVMPKDLLSGLILADFQSDIPEVTRIELIDPREG